MKHLIDAHCHIYPDPIARKAVGGISHFYGDLPFDTYDGTQHRLVESATAAGVDHNIVFSVATTPHQVHSINTYIAREQLASGGRFTGLGTLHLDSEDQEADLDEIEALGLHGVKLHPDIQNFKIDEPRAMHIFAMCEDRGLPIYVHTGDKRYDNSNPNRVKNVLEAFPKLKFVGPHLGGWSVWEEAAKVLPKYDNIIVDTSSSLYELDPDTARDIIRAYGSERVMFGTDYPMWPVTKELEHMEALGLTDEEYENIYWRTCANLFDIKFPGD